VTPCAACARSCCWTPACFRALTASAGCAGPTTWRRRAQREMSLLRARKWPRATVGILLKSTPSGVVGCYVCLVGDSPGSSTRKLLQGNLNLVCAAGLLPTRDAALAPQGAIGTEVAPRAACHSKPLPHADRASGARDPPRDVPRFGRCLSASVTTACPP